MKKGDISGYHPFSTLTDISGQKKTTINQMVDCFNSIFLINQLLGFLKYP